MFGFSKFKLIAGAVLISTALSSVYYGFNYIQAKDEKIEELSTKNERLKNNLEEMETNLSEVKAEYKLAMESKKEIMKQTTQIEKKKRELQSELQDFKEKLESHKFGDLKRSDHRELVLKKINQSVDKQFEEYNNADDKAMGNDEK